MALSRYPFESNAIFLTGTWKQAVTLSEEIGSKGVYHTRGLKEVLKGWRTGVAVRAIPVSLEELNLPEQELINLGVPEMGWGRLIPYLKYAGYTVDSALPYDWTIGGEGRPSDPLYQAIDVTAPRIP